MHKNKKPVHRNTGSRIQSY